MHLRIKGCAPSAPVTTAMPDPCIDPAAPAIGDDALFAAIGASVAPEDRTECARFLRSLRHMFGHATISAVLCDVTELHCWLMESADEERDLREHLRLIRVAFDAVPDLSGHPAAVQWSAKPDWLDDTSRDAPSSPPSSPIGAFRGPGAHGAPALSVPAHLAPPSASRPRTPASSPFPSLWTHVTARGLGRSTMLRRPCFSAR